MKIATTVRALARGSAFLKYQSISPHYFNGFGFTLNNRKVATKKSGTKKMAKTVAESIPPMVPVPMAF